jgi:hypothetical protein
VPLLHLAEQVHRLSPVHARGEALGRGAVPVVGAAGVLVGAGQREVDRRLCGQRDDLAVDELDRRGLAGRVGHQVVQRRAAVEVDVVLLEDLLGLLDRRGLVQHQADDPDAADRRAVRARARLRVVDRGEADRETLLVHAVERQQRGVGQLVLLRGRVGDAQVGQVDHGRRRVAVVRVGEQQHRGRGVPVEVAGEQRVVRVVGGEQ